MDNTRKTPAKSLDALLDIVRIDDLFEWLKAYARKHPDFGQQLAAHIEKQYITSGIGAGDYRTSVDEAFDEAVDSNGYHEWVNPMRIASNLDEVFEEGEHLLELGNPVPAIEISLQALSNLGAEIDNIDDSYGYANSICGQACELLLKAIAHPALAADDVEEYIDEITDDDNIACLGDYGLRDRDDLLAEIYRLTQTPEKQIPLLDKLIAHHPDDHNTHTYVKQKIDCLRQLGKDKEAEKAIKKHLHLPQIRTLAVDDALAMGDRDAALSLLDDGIALARDNWYRGTEREWMQRKVEVYESLGDTPHVVESVRDLFLHENLSEKHYNKLKGLIPPAQWHEFLYGILENLPENHKPDTDNLAHIYIAEGDTQNLYRLIVKGRNTHLHDLDRYASFLSKDYSEKILPVYDDKLRWQATQANGRNDYENIAGSMRAMQQLAGGREAAHALAEFFRATYKRRRAMMEIIRDF